MFFIFLFYKETEQKTHEEIAAPPKNKEKHHKQKTKAGLPEKGSKKSMSSESKNYKFYEDIVSFEDDGGRKVEEHEHEQEYQLIGDDFQKVYTNSTNIEEEPETMLPTEGKIWKTKGCLLTILLYLEKGGSFPTKT